jgi:hypothetical protein
MAVATELRSPKGLQERQRIHPARFVWLIPDQTAARRLRKQLGWTAGAHFVGVKKVTRHHRETGFTDVAFSTWMNENQMPPHHGTMRNSLTPTKKKLVLTARVPLAVNIADVHEARASHQRQIRNHLLDNLNHAIMILLNWRYAILTHMLVTVVAPNCENYNGIFPSNPLKLCNIIHIQYNFHIFLYSQDMHIVRSVQQCRWKDSACASKIRNKRTLVT